MITRPFARLKSWLASVFDATTTVAASASPISATGQNDQQSRQHLVQDWGCSKKLISQILLSGVHNSLGRATPTPAHLPDAP